VLQARRAEQKTQSFKERMRHRNAIEGTQSELVRPMACAERFTAVWLKSTAELLHRRGVQPQALAASSGLGTAERRLTANLSGALATAS